MSPTNIFSPAAQPARWLAELSHLVLGVSAAIFAVVVVLLCYCIWKYRRRTAADDWREPPQVYGSTQIELAWTIIPVLIVVVLFLSSAQVIAATQRAEPGPNEFQVDVVGHQFWWEYRYPGLGVVTANELHIPVSLPGRPIRTVLRLYSADTDHSFWVPRLAGKTDLIPNHPNTMWIEPAEPGLYLGQCAQYCGTQHAKMLLRVYVDTPEDFARWVEAQRRPAEVDHRTSHGREVFQRTACINCHAVSGTPATGRFGPDLTHLMSRETLAAGIAPNNRKTLRQWIQNPDVIKTGSLMPAMALDEADLDAVTDYLLTLR